MTKNTDSDEIRSAIALLASHENPDVRDWAADSPHTIRLLLETFDGLPNGDLDLSASGARVRIEGGTTFATAHLKGAGSAIGFAPGSVLSGTILFEGSNTDSRSVGMNGSTGTFTIGPTGLIRTTADFAGSALIGNFQFSGQMTLVNQGTISSQTSGRTVTVSPSNFTNSGTLEALNGGTLNASNLTAHAGAIRVGLAAGNVSHLARPECRGLRLVC